MNKEELLKEAKRRYPKGTVIKHHHLGIRENFTSTGEFDIDRNTGAVVSVQAVGGDRVVKMDDEDWMEIISPAPKTSWTSPEKRKQYNATRQNKRNLEKARKLFPKGALGTSVYNTPFISDGEFYTHKDGSISIIYNGEILYIYNPFATNKKWATLKPFIVFDEVNEITPEQYEQVARRIGGKSKGVFILSGNTSYGASIEQGAPFDEDLYGGPEGAAQIVNPEDITQHPLLTKEYKKQILKTMQDQNEKNEDKLPTDEGVYTPNDDFYKTPRGINFDTNNKASVAQKIWFILAILGIIALAGIVIGVAINHVENLK